MEVERAGRADYRWTQTISVPLPLPILEYLSNRVLTSYIKRLWYETNESFHWLIAFPTTGETEH